MASSSAPVVKVIPPLPDDAPQMVRRLLPAFLYKATARSPSVTTSPVQQSHTSPGAKGALTGATGMKLPLICARTTCRGSMYPEVNCMYCTTASPPAAMETDGKRETSPSYGSTRRVSPQVKPPFTLRTR